MFGYHFSVLFLVLTEVKTLRSTAPSLRVSVHIESLCEMDCFRTSWLFFWEFLFTTDFVFSHVLGI